MKYVYSQLSNLSNQFMRDSLSRLREFVYFHLDILKTEEMVCLSRIKVSCSFPCLN